MAPSMSSRKSCPTEKRLVMREALKYYNTLLVAAIYRFPDQSQLHNEPAFYFPALKKCVETHPMLAALVTNPTTVNESYTQTDTINLQDHVHILKLPHLVSVAEDQALARAIEHIHNHPDLVLSHCMSIPPWRLDILCLDKGRVFISFTYSHSLGDGMSGVIFHKTFLEAINARDTTADSHLFITSTGLPVLPHLPVSLSYLLAPALGHYLPKLLSRLLGLKASASGSDDETWTGRAFFDDRNTLSQPVQTAVELFSVDGELLSKVLKSCRKHQTKLTALLNELIALCISRRLPQYCGDFPKKTNLVSCIPTNLRKAAGMPESVFGNIASATYSKHPITPGDLAVGDNVWSRAQIQSAAIAKSVVDLRDLPTGLLAWISNMRSWMEEEMGQKRDSSWQISNLMSLDAGKQTISMDKIFFSQPAYAVGIPLNFNTISLRGGDLVICVTWQVAAHGLDSIDGVGIEENERKLVSELLQDLKLCLNLVAET